MIPREEMTRLIMFLNEVRDGDVVTDRSFIFEGPRTIVVGPNDSIFKLPGEIRGDGFLSIERDGVVIW